MVWTAAKPLGQYDLLLPELVPPLCLTATQQDKRRAHINPAPLHSPLACLHSRTWVGVSCLGWGIGPFDAPKKDERRIVGLSEHCEQASKHPHSPLSKSDMTCEYIRVQRPHAKRNRGQAWGWFVGGILQRRRRRASFAFAGAHPAALATPNRKCLCRLCLNSGRVGVAAGVIAGMAARVRDSHLMKLALCALFWRCGPL